MFAPCGGGLATNPHTLPIPEQPFNNIDNDILLLPIIPFNIESRGPCWSMALSP